MTKTCIKVMVFYSRQIFSSNTLYELIESIKQFYKDYDLSIVVVTNKDNADIANHTILSVSFSSGNIVDYTIIRNVNEIDRFENHPSVIFICGGDTEVVLLTCIKEYKFSIDNNKPLMIIDGIKSGFEVLYEYRP